MHIFLLGVAHPVVGKPLQVLEVHRVTRVTQDLNHEENAGNALFCIL